MEATASHKFIDILKSVLIEKVPVHTSAGWNLLQDLWRLAGVLRSGWQCLHETLQESVPVETCALSNFCVDAGRVGGALARGTAAVFRESVPVETVGSEDRRWFVTILLPVLLGVLLCMDQEMTPEKPKEEVPVEPYRIEKGMGDLHGYRMVRASVMGTVMAGETAVYAERDRSSPQRLTLQYGARVNPEEASSRWVSVKAGGTEGFVPRKDLVLYDKRKKLIALTYDDGPDAWGTRRVLNAFQRTHTKGTFFVLGNRINKDTAPLLKRATLLGCEIGNHSWNHAYLPGMRRKNLARQLGRTDYKLRKITGHRPRLVRPPYGAFDRRVKKMAGRPLILWSVDTEDWKYRKTNRLVKYVRIHKRNGAVILMHDIHPSTVRAAEPIIRHLKASGYQLVTVSELAAIRGEKLGVGTVYIGK